MLNPSTITTAAALLKKDDPDLRMMAMSDLLKLLKDQNHDWLAQDPNLALKVSECLVTALSDKNPEVQNLALECVSPFTKICPSSLFFQLLDKLAKLEDKSDDTSSHSATAMSLRVAIQALPRPTPGVNIAHDCSEAFTAVNEILIPRFMGSSSSRSTSSNAWFLDPKSKKAGDGVETLIEVLNCFGTVLDPVEVRSLSKLVIALIEAPTVTDIIKKRAVVAVASLATVMLPALFDEFLGHLKSQLQQPGVNSKTQRHYLFVLASLCRAVPSRINDIVSMFAPIVLSTLSEQRLRHQLHLVAEGEAGDPEFDAVQEAAFAALNSFLTQGSSQMRPFVKQTIATCLSYLKYDPYVVQNDEDDDGDVDMAEGEEEDDDFGNDDEFLDQTAFDDDDSSWKIRRGAANALHSLVLGQVNGNFSDDGALYRDAAPCLIKRFDEREENVRLDIIAAMAVLIRKTGTGTVHPSLLNEEGDHMELLSKLPHSRKRRRVSSNAEPSAIHAASTSDAGLPVPGVLSPVEEKPPTTGPRADLSKVTPSLVKAVLKNLSAKPLATKQALLELLNDLVDVQQSALAAYFGQLVGHIIDALNMSGPATMAGGSSSATSGTLRASALRLTSNVARTHSSSVLQPHLAKLVDACLAATTDKYYKASAEAFRCAEDMVNAMTPPRSTSFQSENQPLISKAFDIFCEKSNDNSADAEVRQKAIHALGVLLARTLSAEGASLLPADKRIAGLKNLQDRLANEVTRSAAVKAIAILASCSTVDTPLSIEWVEPVALELVSQVRKSNHAIRSSSIQALSNLIQAPNVRGKMSQSTTQTLFEELHQILDQNDPLIVAPVATVLARLIAMSPSVCAGNDLSKSLCKVLKGSVSMLTLDSIVQLAVVLGENKQGKALLNAILQDVGVKGDLAATGRVVGALLVATPNAPVTLDDFISEINRAGDKDPDRASLALIIIGEASYRLGSRSPIKPDSYLKWLHHENGKVSLAAARASGRAAAGNVNQFVPILLEEAGTQGKQFLALVAIEELVRNVTSSSHPSSTWHWAPIWDLFVGAVHSEDNRPMCAECLGRICLAEPQEFRGRLEALLKDNDRILRAVAVQAFRYTLSESGNGGFDVILKQILVTTLAALLQDPDLEVRRLGLSTLTSAAHNKPEIIMPNLNHLTPFVMKETVINQDLISEVIVGPFKHKIDKGLDLRKGAYETLNALMTVAFDQLDRLAVFDRVVEGLSEDNDIRPLSSQMLRKLFVLDYTEAVRRLDVISEKLRAALLARPKENAVKSELEQFEETTNLILRMTMELENKTSKLHANQSAKTPWTKYLEWIHVTYHDSEIVRRS